MQELILVGILVFLAVLTLGGAIIALRDSQRKALQNRLAELEIVPPSAPEQAATSTKGKALQAVSWIGAVVSSGSPSQNLGQHLARAGYYSKSAPLIYLGLKVVLLVAGLLIPTLLLLPMAFSAAYKVPIILACGVILFLLPNFILDRRRKNIRNDIRQHLPDVIDLLEICVSSGMGLDMAWNMVGDEIRHVAPALADEMALTNLEVHLGAPRVAAMRHMAERTGAEEVASLAAMLVQSERFGTSVADALRTFTVSMRESRSTQAQEAAEKTAVKLLFPMVLFIFPALLVVLVGPAALRLAQLIWSQTR